MKCPSLLFSLMATVRVTALMMLVVLGGMVSVSGNAWATMTFKQDIVDLMKNACADTGTNTGYSQEQCMALYLHLWSVETHGTRCQNPCGGLNHMKNGSLSCDWGMMQINEAPAGSGRGTISICADKMGYPGRGRQFIWDMVSVPDRYKNMPCQERGVRARTCPRGPGEGCSALSVQLAVQCGKIIMFENGKRCTGFAAKMCAYNAGPRFCQSGTMGCIKIFGGKNRPKNYRCVAGPNSTCEYAQRACQLMGTDCGGSQSGNYNISLACDATKMDAATFAQCEKDYQDAINNSKIGTAIPAGEYEGKGTGYFGTTPDGQGCVDPKLSAAFMAANQLYLYGSPQVVRTVEQRRIYEDNAVAADNSNGIGAVATLAATGGEGVLIPKASGSATSAVAKSTIPEKIKGVIQAQSEAYNDAMSMWPFKEKMKCIGDMQSAYDVIMGIITGTLSKIAAAIALILTSILNFVCNAVLTVINTLLAQLCVPVPDLGLGYPTLPSLKRGYCSGVQLVPPLPGEPVQLPKSWGGERLQDVRRPTYDWLMDKKPW